MTERRSVHCVSFLSSACSALPRAIESPVCVHGSYSRVRHILSSVMGPGPPMYGSVTTCLSVIPPIPHPRTRFQGSTVVVLLAWVAFHDLGQRKGHAQPDTGGHRRTQEDTGGHRRTRGDTGRHMATQKDTEGHGRTRKDTE